MEKYAGYIHTYGLKDRKGSKTASTKILYNAMDGKKQVATYETNPMLRPGFLFLVINKFDGAVEFEAK